MEPTRDLWGTDEQRLTSGHILQDAVGSEGARLLTETPQMDYVGGYDVFFSTFVS